MDPKMLRFGTLVLAGGILLGVVAVLLVGLTGAPPTSVLSVNSSTMLALDFIIIFVANAFIAVAAVYLALGAREGRMHRQGPA